jgi:hypothetical protein
VPALFSERLSTSVASMSRITGEPTLVTLERRRYTAMTKIATLPPGGRFASGKPKG